MNNAQTTTTQEETLDPNALRRRWFPIFSPNPNRAQVSVAAMTRDRFTCNCIDNSNCFHSVQFRLWRERQSIQQLRREQSSSAAPSVTVPAAGSDQNNAAVNQSSVETNSKQRTHSTLFAIIRRSLRAKEDKARVLDSLKLLQVMKLDGTVQPNPQTGGYDGPDFRIDPSLNHIVEVKTGRNGNTQSYPFRKLASLMDETRSVANEIRKHNNCSVSIRGLVSIDFSVNVNGKPANYRIIGKNIYQIGKRGGMAPAKREKLQPIVKLLHIPSPCVCGKSHYLWGMEIEFDAYNYTKLYSNMVDASIPFCPVGRDGAGQGEVRSNPDNDFARTASSALENYRKALSIVAESKKEMEKVVFLVKQLKQEVKSCKNLDIEAWLEKLPVLIGEKSPNGIHIHGPSSDYLEKALDIVAIWWNQHSPQAKAMLEIRTNHNYGRLGSNGIRKSGVCSKKCFTEYRQLNSDTPEEIEEFLVPVLVRIFNENPPLPTIEKMTYHDPLSYRIASEFCCNLIGKTAEHWEISGRKSSSPKIRVISSSEFRQGLQAEAEEAIAAEVGHV